MRNGRVVGILESRTGPDGSTVVTPETLAASFPDDKTADTPSAVSDDRLARATVVVPTLCRDPAGLSRTIESLLQLDYPDFEVVVVDNRSGERRLSLPEFPNDPRLHLAQEAQQGISAARNRGVSTSTGEFVAFTDDDALVDEHWLRVFGSRFALDGRIEAIGGLVLPSELETEPQLWFEEFYGGFTRSFHAELLSIESQRGVDKLFPYAPARFGAGCNMAIRREVLERIGGFNTALGTGTPAKGGEDLAMFIELVNSGSTVAFEPAALVRHSHRRTEREFLRQVFAYGTGLTAMFTAIIVRDPRQALSLIQRVPDGLRLLMRPQEQRSPSEHPSYPRRATAYQLLGMAYGPLAYAYSAARVRWPP
jgi:GT2 family glycosyltransferase